MSMASTSVVIISGAAALGGSIVTGVIASGGVKRTLNANAESLVGQLKHERRLAREARDQERREVAYVAILKYVNWLIRYLGYLASPVASEILHHVASEPDEEQDVVRGPTAEENEATLALVTATASRQVLEVFKALLDEKKTLESRLVTAKTAYGRKATDPGAIDLASTALSEANAALRKATAARNEITELIRSELNPTQ